MKKKCGARLKKGHEFEERGFFTYYEEPKKRADYVYGRGEGVYKNGVDGKELISGASYVYWCEEGVYKYGVDGKEALVKDGKELISGVSFVYWRGEGKFDWKNDGVQCKGEIVK